MADKPALNVELLNVRYGDGKPAKYAYRSRVPGGWLIFTYTPGRGGLCGVTFLPDADHAWDGGSQQAGTEQSRKK